MRSHQKLISLLLLILSVICLMALSSAAPNSSLPSTQVQAKWLLKLPQLDSNIGYQKLTQSAPKISPELAPIAGNISNPLGIRDEILDYIVQTIPATNESGQIAAIKLIQYEYAIYFNNQSQEQAMQLAGKALLACWCLFKSLSLEDSLRIPQGILNIIQDTPERFNYFRKIDLQYFSWKIIGTGLNMAEEDQACEEGRY